MIGIASIKSKFLDYVVLAVLLVAAPLISLYFNPPLLVALVFFYVLPSLWLAFRGPQYIKRAAIFSALAVVFFLIIDYIAVIDGGWWVSSIFEYRFLGVLPIEDSIWLFFGLFTMIMAYEYFDDSGPHEFKKTRIKYLGLIIALVAVVFMLLLFIKPSILNIPYAYLWIGILFSILPIVIILWMYPVLIKKFIRTAIYIFFLHLLFELVALRLGYWSFPGTNFIGWIQVFGVRLPIEEFVFWIALGGTTILSYFEFYADDRK